MSKSEILAELRRLSAEERREVFDDLAEMEQDEWSDPFLTAREKAVIEERFLDLEKNPGASIPWEKAKAELLSLFKR